MPRAVRILRGRWTRDLVGLAEQYGPVVRVAPHVLVYTGADAWQDIYAHGNGAVAKGEELGKDPQLYRSRGFAPSLLGETRDNHALLRRQMSHGFSEKSLRAQEDIIMGYFDLFIRRLRERCFAAEGKQKEEEVAVGALGETTAVDMKAWFNFTTFDVIGDLALGEPFGCLEHGKMDPRVDFLEAGLQSASRTFFVKELGVERFLRVIFRRAGAARMKVVEQMQAVLRRRMALGGERPDLIEGLLRKQEDWVRRLID